MTVFASRPAIENYLETWFVDEPHMLLTNTGHRQDLRATKNNVQVIGSADPADYAELVRRWLLYSLQTFAKASEHRKSLIVGAIDFEPMSTDDLCRLILLL